MLYVSKVTLAAVLVAGATLITSSSVAAYGLGGDGQGPRGDGEGREMQGEGRRGGDGEGRGKRFHLMPKEMKEEFRAEHENLSDEEREQLREERKARRDEKRQEMEEFSGVSREEMKEAHKNGDDVGDLLTQNGKTQEDYEVFFTERANEHVDEITERHDLSDDQVAILRARISEFVSNMTGKWFK